MEVLGIALAQNLGHDAPVDRSGTIAVGGTQQLLMPANLKRRGFFVQNNSSGDLWFNELGAAVLAGPSIKIPAGSTLSSTSSWSPTGAISIIGATTAQAFTAREV